MATDRLLTPFFSQLYTYPLAEADPEGVQWYRHTPLPDHEAEAVAVDFKSLKKVNIPPLCFPPGSEAHPFPSPPHHPSSAQCCCCIPTVLRARRAPPCSSQTVLGLGSAKASARAGSPSLPGPPWVFSASPGAGVRRGNPPAHCHCCCG